MLGVGGVLLLVPLALFALHGDRSYRRDSEDRNPESGLAKMLLMFLLLLSAMAFGAVEREVASPLVWIGGQVLLAMLAIALHIRLGPAARWIDVHARRLDEWRPRKR